MKLTMYVTRNEPIATIVDGEAHKFYKLELVFARPPNPDGSRHSPQPGAPDNDPNLVACSNVTLMVEQPVPLRYGQAISVELEPVPIVDPVVEPVVEPAPAPQDEPPP